MPYGRSLISAGFIFALVSGALLCSCLLLSSCNASNAVGVNVAVINDTAAPVTVTYEKVYWLIFFTYYSTEQINLGPHQQKDLTVSLKLNRYEINVFQASEEIRYRNDVFKRVVRISPGDFKLTGNG